MRKLSMILWVLLLGPVFVDAQEYRKDFRARSVREDSCGQYHAEDIDKLDLLRALDIAGIGIHRFSLGTFPKKYRLTVWAEEYRDGKVVEKHRMMDGDNGYLFWEGGRTEPYVDYIDVIKFFTKTEDGTISVVVDTCSGETSKRFKMKKDSDDQFFQWRSWRETTWKLGEKVPLLVYASSWRDQQLGAHRFCGVVNLSLDAAMTEELLGRSPHYILFSYVVSEWKGGDE